MPIPTPFYRPSPFDGFLQKHRYLIHDRDPPFTRAFVANLLDAGVKIIKPPPSSPNLNALAERLVGSIGRECLEHIIRAASSTCGWSFGSLPSTTTKSVITKVSATN